MLDYIMFDCDETPFWEIGILSPTRPYRDPIIFDILAVFRCSLRKSAILISIFAQDCLLETCVPLLP